ncbi:hypothetical protein ACN28S_27630 [Cystobacter fuscus]
MDVFSFQAQAGHLYAFTCNPGGGATDCRVSLSDAVGQVLAVDNNGGTGFIVYEYPTAGTYFFRVSSGRWVPTRTGWRISASTTTATRRPRPPR